MDPRSSAQDVNRCDLCETAIVHSYCDFCHVNLCKPCVVDHISDEYDKHKIVPFQKRGSTLIHSKCETHPHRNCEFQCKDCNNMFVCSSCMASKQHKGHNFVEVTEVYKAKKDDIKKDTKELKNHISPTYEEIALDLDNQLANLDGGYDKLTTTISKQGEQWHKEIDIVINKMTTEISDIKVKHKELLQKHLNDIKQIQSLIKKTLHALRKIEKSTKVSPIIEYSSKIREFSKFPPKVHVPMPTFIPKPIDRDKLYTFFGQIVDDKDGMYINKEGEDDHIFFEPVIQLPEKVDVVTGEEDEKVLFEHRAKLFRFHNKVWKERGLGDIKILENKASKKIRVLMRREQILKVCCNHYITDKLDLKPMPNSNGKAWTWYAMDHSDDEPKCEQFSVRFKTPEIANKFKEAFDNAKKKLSGLVSTERTPSSPAASGTSSRPPAILQTLLSEDDDVIYIKKEMATPAQVEMARKVKLPDHFYLYEYAPPCPGCIGCEDYKEGSKNTQKTKSPTPKKNQDKDMVSKTSDTDSSSSGGLFGASAAPPGGLFCSLAAGGGDSKETTGLFGQPLFGGGGGSSFSFSGLAANVDTQPAAFKKDNSKPFSWSGAGQKLFNQEEGEEDGEEVTQGYDPHFKPVVPLPDLVKVKTGEEGFEKLFSHRAKLFRYDKDTNQWKEKGIGEMKILRHNGTGQYRLLLRREQVYKLACNQWLIPDLKFQPMLTSETAWCWVGQDFSDNEAKLEQLAVKFKSIELAKEFKDKIDECQKNLIENPPTVSAEPQQSGTTSQESLEEEHGSDDKDDATHQIEKN
nr:RANBP2-like and GRIP domain-containing protein 5/6 isoform X2 [Crassostrea gigas]